jgi:hypothetical protein
MSVIKVNTIQNANGTTALTIAANGQLSRVNTAIISDGTYSTSANNVIQGSAKAWVRFSVSGSTVTVNGNYNLSSVSRSQAGVYVFSFTTNLPDANYSVVTSQGLDTSSGTSMIPILFRNASGNLTPTTSSFSVVFVAPSTGTAYDPIVVGLVVNGN